MCWYLVFTKPRNEAQAEDQLLKQHYDVFRPRIRIRKLKGAALVTITESLFPRYLFIQLDETSCDWVGVRSTRGVSNFVRFGQYPTKVPVRMIEEIKDMVDAENIIDHTVKREARFKEGDLVEVVAGGLRGRQALVLSPSGEERVVVMLNILGRELPVAMPIACVSAGDSSLARMQGVSP
jgi:transcriptional antiterminator RfaH